MSRNADYRTLRQWRPVGANPVSAPTAGPGGRESGPVRADWVGSDGTPGARPSGNGTRAAALWLLLGAAVLPQLLLVGPTQFL